MDKLERQRFLWLKLLEYDVPKETIDQILDVWQNDAEDQYDRAATHITRQLQDCIPSSAATVPDARVQGAWRDAAKIALNHIGRSCEHGRPH